MNGASPLKHGVVDLAAILFVIGGIVSLVMTILSLPIGNLYPLSLSSGFNMSMTAIVVLGVTLVCSLGAIHCYSLTVRRMLSEAGIRGIVFGTLLLIFSFGLAGSLREANTNTTLTAISSVLILIAGIVAFALRHTSISASSIARQHVISQPTFQS
jgi:hypothetical protein